MEGCGGYKGGRSLYLALDVNPAESGCFVRFEQRSGLASQDGYAVRPLFEQVLSSMVNDELGSVGIGLETEFLGDETKFYVGFIPVSQVSIGRHAKGKEGGVGCQRTSWR